MRTASAYRHRHAEPHPALPTRPRTLVRGLRRAEAGRASGPNLVSCVLPTGFFGVFPHTTCAALRLPESDA